jgi:membrane protease YdiL (CAAX protease family)
LEDGRKVKGVERAELRRLTIAAKSSGWRLGRALFATLVMLGVVTASATWGGDLPIPTLAGLSPGLVRSIAVQAALMGTVLALAHWITGLGNVGLRRSGAWTSLVLMVPILLLSLMDAKAFGSADAPKVLGLVLLALMVGFTEETYARGFLVTLLGGRRHALLAIAGSSVLFAYLHLPSYSMRFGWPEAFLRSTASAAFSASAAIVVLRSGSIIGPFAFHFINDALMLLGTQSPRPASSGAAAARADLDYRPLIVGLVLALAYWLACRRQIAAAAAAQGSSGRPPARLGA